METRRLIIILTGIAVAIVLAIGGIIAISSLGGDDGGGSQTQEDGSSDGDGDGGDGVDLPERIQGELRLFGPDIITLDPACASDAGSAEYIVEIFSGLVSWDQDLNLIPDIAERWDVSPDGLTYTFHLRSNVLFHDASRRVTAADFKFSMERALNPDTQSTVGEVYLDDIAGAEEFVDEQADEVTGINVIDDNTLEITITEPSAVFLDKLTYPTAYVVDQREVRDATCFAGAEWTLSPNGTGPFKLDELELGQRVVLEANDAFYLDPKPSLEKVTYLLSGGSALTMYENDEIDVTGVGINDIERIRDPNEPLNAEFTESESLDVFYIGFNTTREPFNDPDVRKALSMSIDKRLLAEEILAELVIEAKGVLPPGMPGYNEGLDGLPFDVDAAVELLEEAGGPQVLDDVVLITPGRGASPGVILDAIVAMWEQNLGVTITVEQQDFGLFLRTIDQRDFDMFSLGWIADYPDPQNFLDIKLHSQSEDNETGYSNSEVDRLLDEARRSTDDEQRYDLYQQAEEIIVEESPWVPLYHTKGGALVKPYVQGFTNPPFVIPRMRYVSIEN